MIDTKGEKFPQKKSSLKMEPFQIDGRRHSMHCDMRVSMRKSSDKLLDLALFETGDWGRWVTTESGRIMYQHFPNPNSMGNLKHGRFCLCSGDCICSWFGNTDMTPRELDEMKNLANAEQQNNNLFDVNETKETDKEQSPNKLKNLKYVLARKIF